MAIELAGTSGGGAGQAVTPPPLPPLTPTRRQLLETMKHDDVTRHVLAHAERHGWRARGDQTRKMDTGHHITAYFHEPANGITTGKGFPDIVMIGHGWVALVEVKTGTGRLEPDQRRWRELALEAELDNLGSRVQHIVVRPSGIPRLEAFIETRHPWYLDPDRFTPVTGGR